MTDKSFEKLARGSYYLVLSSITNLTIGALFWIVLAKITDPVILGQVMVVIAIATSIIGFAGYGVQVTISKYISEYNARNMIDNSRKVLQLGLKIALIVSGSAALCIALLSGHIASTAYQNPSLAPLIIFVVITYLPAQTVIASITGAFQGSHKMQYNFLTYLIYELARLAIAVTLVLYGLGSFGILIGFAVASIAVSLLGYTCMIPKVVPRSRAGTEEKVDHRVKHILTFSGLNYFSVGMRTLSAQIGVLILGTLNFEWAAFYGVSVLIANVVGGISLAISKAMLPTASEQWAKGKSDEFKGVLNAAIRISLLLAGVGFLVFMINPSYVLGLLSESYTGASSALRILVISSIINAVGAIMISMLNAANRAYAVAKIGLVSSASAIALTFVLAPLIGIEGAATAILVSSLSNLVLSTVMLKRKEHLTVSVKSVTKPLVSILVGLVVGYALYNLSDNIIISVALALLSYAGFSVIYRVMDRTELKTILAIVLRTKKS